MDNNTPSVYYQPNVSVGTLTKREPKIKLAKKDLIFALVSFVLSFVIVDFVFFHGFKLGFTIAFLLLFAVLTAYLFDKNNHTSIFTYLCGAMSIAGAISFTIYDDVLINSIMMFLILALFCIYICGISDTFTHKQGSYKMLCDTLKSIFVLPFSSVYDIKGAYSKAMSKSKISKNVIIGIALSIPVLLVIIPLLVSSDIAFENLIKIVLKNIGKYLLEIVIAIVITPFIILYVVSKKI